MEFRLSGNYQGLRSCEDLIPAFEIEEEIGLILLNGAAQAGAIQVVAQNRFCLDRKSVV